MLRAAIAAVAIAPITAAPAAAASALSWGPRIQVNYDPSRDPNNNTNTYYGLNAVSCTAQQSCAALGSEGSSGPYDVFYSNNPNGGSSAWKKKTIDTAPLRSISCLPSLCVAGDSSGNISVSSNPFSSTPSWSTPAGISSGPPAVNSISCPSTALCVAVGYGEVVTSTDPAGGISKWTAVPVDALHPLTAVSCPTTSFCEAVDSQGNSVSSTDPTGGSSKWTVHTAVDTNQLVQSLSCPSSSLCVAIDTAGDDGHIATSTSPSSNTAWKTVNVEPAMSFRTVWAVSCPSVSLCLVVDDSGYAFTSTNASGGAWSSWFADGRGSPTSVSCSPTDLCTLVDTYGNAYVGHLPPPNTRITASSISQSTHQAKFTFTGTGVVSGFQCELRRNGHPATFSRCTSPKTYSNLAPGSYRFLVRAFNVAGVDLTPATRAFAIGSPPNTKITAATISKAQHMATFNFKATGAAKGFQCELRKKGGQGSFSSCHSPKTYKNLAKGSYTFLVRAFNAAGPDPTPATRSFTI